MTDVIKWSKLWQIQPVKSKREPKMLSLLINRQFDEDRYGARIRVHSGWTFVLPKQPAPAVGQWKVVSDLDCELVAIYCDNTLVAKEQFKSRFKFNPTNFVFMDMDQVIHVHSREYKITYSVRGDYWLLIRWRDELPGYVTEAQWGLDAPGVSQG